MNLMGLRGLTMLNTLLLASVLFISSSHAQSPGYTRSSLLPPPPDYLAGDQVVVLIEGKSTSINCDGSCRIVAIGNEEILDCKGKDCPKAPVSEATMPTKTCQLELTPKVKYGFTNLIMRTTRNSVHRKIEIRTARDPAAIKKYQAKVDICQ